MYQHDFINLFVNGNPVDGSRVSFKLNVNKILIPYKSYSGSTYYFDFTFSSDHTKPSHNRIVMLRDIQCPRELVNIAKKNRDMTLRASFTLPRRN